MDLERGRVVDVSTGKSPTVHRPSCPPEELDEVSAEGGDETQATRGECGVRLRCVWVGEGMHFQATLSTPRPCV
jgi:hypothetical protein